MRLHLLRHAHAGDPVDWEGDDALRPLTQKGRQQSRAARGASSTQHGIRPDVIVSSPKVRALQTAEIVAAALGMTVRIDARLGEGFGQRELWALLDELGAREPMLVGHDPDLSSLLAYLIDAAGIAACARAPSRRSTCPRSSATADGTLRWLVPPDLLEARSVERRGRRPTSRGQASGTEKLNVEPLPSVDSTQMPPAVGLGDVAGDGEAETGAAVPALTRPVDLVEALEDARLVRPRDAHALVGHRR